jgi:hypothetical protein
MTTTDFCTTIESIHSNAADTRIMSARHKEMCNEPYESTDEIVGRRVVYYTVNFFNTLS